ncbi:ABC transporter ATP-binding protein [Gephyromycinifex aptenodytis]|uniref:ABC transporter ATP-binding protein n=1 Tax=Gephyromycinifex aptenodytis TaxID=2716227 RepID=UPI001444A300|nr:ABC transporter ATP-binding protein [Gephyromycinifex aptenodytis]
MTSLRIHDVDIMVGTRHLVEKLALEVRDSEFLGLVGPNGSGKSTLLRAIYRHIKPTGGAIYLDDVNVQAMKPAALARQIAVCAQHAPSELELTVAQIVALGRLPHQGVLGTERAGDRDIVQRALETVGISDLADRSWLTLSGGERQRTLLARALAQQGSVVILDEPTNHLDIQHQLEILSLVRELGVTTIAAIHELNLAMTYCDRVAVIDDGQIVAIGEPAVVFSPELVRRVFNVDARLIQHPDLDTPHLAFRPIPRKGKP